MQKTKVILKSALMAIPIALTFPICSFAFEPDEIDDNVEHRR